MQICLHSCGVIVLDVFFFIAFCVSISYILVILAPFCVITVFMDTCQCKTSCLGAPAL